MQEGCRTSLMQGRRIEGMGSDWLVVLLGHNFNRPRDEIWEGLRSQDLMIIVNPKAQLQILMPRDGGVKLEEIFLE